MSKLALFSANVPVIKKMSSSIDASFPPLGFSSGVGVVSVFSLVLRAPTLWMVVGQSGPLSILTAVDRVGEGCSSENGDV